METPNTQTVAEMQGMVDRTTFGTVSSHILDPTSPITEAVLISPGHDLATIAATFVDATGDDARETIEALIDNQAIQSGMLPGDAPCHVIYSPPFYFVKLANSD